MRRAARCAGGLGITAFSIPVAIRTGYYPEFEPPFRHGDDGARAPAAIAGSGAGGAPGLLMMGS